MPWIGARAYECERSHWFAVTELSPPPRLCPVCGSDSVRYMGDSEVPIFVLQVEDVREIARYDDEEDEDEIHPFRGMSVEACIDLGSDLETPWEAVEALAELALEAETTSP